MPRLRWAFLIASCSMIARCAAARAEPPPPVRAVGCIGLTVSDLDRSVTFYSSVLSFHGSAAREQARRDVAASQGLPGARLRTARLLLGAECLELTEYLAPRGKAPPVDLRSDDRSFQHVAIVVSDMDAAYAKVRGAGVEQVSPAPQRLPDWNAAAGGIQAFYFRDPDRHALELLQFPAGKGAARWQRKDALFLGIDHTAIVVRDTGTSLAFYGGALGLAVAGRSENWGAEQERLNAVPGAHLRITTLRAAGGPGIELLEYLAPRAGRDFPAGELPNDLIHWQTTVVGNPARLTDLLRARGAPFVSTFLARDPDGHVLQLAGE